MKKILVIVGMLLLFGLALIAKNIFLGEKNPEVNKSEQKKTASVSAVFSSAEKPPEKPSQPEEEGKNVQLLFLGDVMLDRDVKTAIQRKGQDFMLAKIKNIFAENDETIFNLEGPVTKNNSVSVGTIPGQKGHIIFTFDSEITKKFLQDVHSKTVFLGNNHILNFGKSGLAETENFLTENNIQYFIDLNGENKYLEKEIAGQKLVFVAFNQFSGQNAETLAGQIKTLKKVDNFVVVYAHWGTEYARQENAKQKEWAHNFIDAGADLIIGSHPHVIEPVEEYKNKLIFYSLGNFVFDQYFSPETMQGLAVKINIQKDIQEINLLPISINKDASLSLSEEKSKNTLLSWLAENSTVSDELKAEIKNGYFKVKNN